MRFASFVFIGASLLQGCSESPAGSAVSGPTGSNDPGIAEERHVKPNGGRRIEIGEKGREERSLNSGQPNEENLKVIGDFDTCMRKTMKVVMSMLITANRLDRVERSSGFIEEECGRLHEAVMGVVAGLPEDSEERRKVMRWNKLIASGLRETGSEYINQKLQFIERFPERFVATPEMAAEVARIRTALAATGGYELFESEMNRWVANPNVLPSGINKDTRIIVTNGRLSLVEDCQAKRGPLECRKELTDATDSVREVKNYIFDEPAAVEEMERRLSACRALSVAASSGVALVGIVKPSTEIATVSSVVSSRTHNKRSI